MRPDHRKPWTWPTLYCNMRHAVQANKYIEAGQLFRADALGVKAYVDGKWYKPSEVPESFGFKRVEKPPKQETLF